MHVYYLVHYLVHVYYLVHYLVHVYYLVHYLVHVYYLVHYFIHVYYSEFMCSWLRFARHSENVQLVKVCAKLRKCM